LAFDQFHAHLLGQEHVLEIGRVVGPRRHHHDGGLVFVEAVFRRQRAQRFEELVGIVAHGAHAVVAEELGEKPHHRFAVFEHVGHARRRACIVFEHVELVFGYAHHVDARDMRVDIAG